MATNIGLPGEALTALGRKYASLVQLRERRDAAPGAPPTPELMRELKQLATEFPGCLRELDRVNLLGLQQRAIAVAAARAGGPHAPWLVWMWGYHVLLATALAAKRGGANAQAARVAEMQRPGSVATWPPVTSAFLAGARAPPDGRLSRWVLWELASLTGQPAEVISEALFPPRQ